MNKFTLKTNSNVNVFNKTIKNISKLEREKLKKKTSNSKIMEKQKINTNNMQSYKQNGRFNDLIINSLEKLTEIYNKKGDWTRSKSYQKATELIMLVNYDINLTTINKVSKIHGIGPNITSKIKELIEDGQIKTLEKEKNDPLIKLTEIHGIGPKKAQELISMGIVSIDDLKKSSVKLNDIQKLGLEYYDEISTRIPRVEIEKFEKLFKNLF